MEQLRRFEFEKEGKLREPSPRKRLGTLPTQLAGVQKVTFDPEQAERIMRALVQHAKRQAGEE